MSQGALFRLSDPSTSRHAGEQAAVHGYRGLKATLLELLKARGVHGATRGELQALLASRGVTEDRGTISRRLTDLRRMGEVAAVDVRDGQSVWVVSEYAPLFGAA